VAVHVYFRRLISALNLSITILVWLPAGALVRGSDDQSTAEFDAPRMVDIRGYQVPAGRRAPLLNPKS
jgi:hypothetical protein